jgi:hypothetical protein
MQTTNLLRKATVTPHLPCFHATCHHPIEQAACRLDGSTCHQFQVLQLLSEAELHHSHPA